MVVPRQQNTSCTRGKSLSCARRSKSIRRCVSFLCVSGTSRRASTVTRSYAGFASSSRSTWLPTRPDAPATKAVRATRSAPEREQHAHDHEIGELIAGVDHPRGEGLSARLSRDHERSEEHTSELQSRFDLVCRLLLEKKKKISTTPEAASVTTLEISFAVAPI